MPLRMFLKIDGIEGESNAQGHVNEIDILSFTWAAANAAGSAGAGAGAGKVTFENATMTKAVDRASPPLFHALATGQHIKQCILTVEEDRKPAQLTSITFTNFLIASITEAFATSADVPQETIVISFAQFQISYTPQKTDGSADTPITAGWNLATNAPN